MRRALLSYSVALALIGALILRPASAQGETWIIRNARVVPVSGPALERGSVVVRDGLIAEVGAEVAVPPGAKELDGQGLNVYPGLIDLHTALAQPAQMPADRAPKNPAQPDLGTAEGQLKAVPSGITPAWRVETVLQAGSSDLEAARGAGVTTALSAPRQGCVPGQGAFIYTRGERAEDLPAGAVAPLYFQFTNPGGHYPATLLGILAAQRQALLDAQRARETPSGAADPTSAALLPLLGGERPAFFVAGREREIRRVLRLCDEFRMRPVIAGGDEAGRVASELRDYRAAVLFSLGAVPKSAPADRPDPAETPAALLRVGVPVALTSGGLQGYKGFYPAVRRLLDAGVTEAQALRALTLAPAEILGVNDRFGTVEPGRAANLIVTDGPLFDTRTRIRRLFIRGVPVEPPPAKEQPPVGPPAPAPAENARTAEPTPSGGRPVLIRNGTLLTISHGVIRNGSVLIQGGKITAVGTAASVLAPPDTRIIDATGRFVMPGIVDAHSHMAIEGGINEGTYNVTPEVRVGDCINPRDVTIYRALAGGVTTVHTMHGSANVIGGQNATIKLKWGQPAEALLVPNAPRTVKLALGENPKRSNGGGGRGGAPQRYPATRMGVENVLRQSFTAARAYAAGWDRYRSATQRGEKAAAPRRDLRLEALADILAGRLLVQAHSYRADEILMLLRVAEEFGFRVRTLHHALEAYKVAPEIARHGASVSTFADFWGYKVEAFDAIPHNAALCTRAGVRVSLNSDSNERVRRLYWEAAKPQKYGGLSEAEALKTITLNPAWQLGIDYRVGSLDLGKDGDIAIFSAHPFSPSTVCETTLVEGEVYFDRKEDLQRRGKPGYPGPESEAALNIGSHDECGCDDLDAGR